MTYLEYQAQLADKVARFGLPEELHAEVLRLRAENALLKRALEMVCQQTAKDTD